MTPEERIRAGGVVLVFDVPNVSTRRLFTLAKAAKHCGRDLRLVVPVTAHTEKLTHLRRDRKAPYDANVVQKSLEDAEVEILPLDAKTAEAVAAQLHAWFPGDEDWQDAKWRRLHGGVRRGENNKPPATIDWYTAALCPPGSIVVTDDAGVEYHGCERIESAVLEVVLREIATMVLR